MGDVPSPRKVKLIILWKLLSENFYIHYFITLDCRICEVTVTNATKNNLCGAEFLVSSAVAGRNSLSPYVTCLKNGEVFVTYHQLCKRNLLKFEKGNSQ